MTRNGTTVEAAVNRQGDGGRVPPHNLDIEQDLLGAMLMSRDAIVAAVEGGIGPDDFYRPVHGHIYDAITSMWGGAEAVDVDTVAEELRRADLLEAVGGPAAIVALQARVPAISSATKYARVVAELSQLRRVQHWARGIAEAAADVPVDVPAFMDETEAALFGLRRTGDPPSAYTYSDAVGEWLDAFAARCESGGVVDLSTGWPDLDEITAGLHRSELTILGGRTGMGKTSCAIALVGNVAATGVPVLVVSIEMGYQEMAGRAVVAEAIVDGAAVRLGRVSDSDRRRIDLAASTVAALPVEIADASTATLMSVRARARRMASRRGLGMVVVDYLQLMAGRRGAENRQVEVAELAQGLKILARELKVPVVALAQLSRALESRSDKRPTLADLRESGNIENSADTVIFVYRDEYYRPDTEDRGVAELIVAKQRNGPQGVVRLAADMRYGTWRNMARAGVF